MHYGCVFLYWWLIGVWSPFNSQPLRVICAGTSICSHETHLISSSPFFSENLSSFSCKPRPFPTGYSSFKRRKINNLWNKADFDSLAVDEETGRDMSCRGLYGSSKELWLNGHNTWPRWWVPPISCHTGHFSYFSIIMISRPFTEIKGSITHSLSAAFSKKCLPFCLFWTVEG